MSERETPEHRLTHMPAFTPVALEEPGFESKEFIRVRG